MSDSATSAFDPGADPDDALALRIDPLPGRRRGGVEAAAARPIELSTQLSPGRPDFARRHRNLRPDPSPGRLSAKRGEVA